MKVVFFGTPEFAATSLATLHASGHEVLAAVTAPDRQGGRGGREIIVSEVKQLALKLGVPVLQPTSLKSPKFQKALEKLSADLFVVVAFRMLPEAVWSMPRLGSINVHGSLLPAYRGAAPIHWAVRAGEKQTGVSVFFLQHDIDTGDILHQKACDIGPDEDLGSVYNRLQVLGAEALLEALNRIEQGETQGRAQDPTTVTHAAKLTRDNTRLDWTLSAEAIHNSVRGLHPFPLAWTLWGAQEVKLLRTGRLTDVEQAEIRGLAGFGESLQVPEPTSLRGPKAGFGESLDAGQNRQLGGRIALVKLQAGGGGQRRLMVMGGDGHWLELLDLRPSGKTSMSGAAWANGAKLTPEARFE